MMREPPHWRRDHVRDAFHLGRQRSRLATGWLDGELSSVGREQASELGARHGTVDVVFTSDLHRAVQTADIAFGGTGVPIFRDWRLRECNYGAMNGVNVEELERTRRSHIDEPFEGGESYRHVVDRTRELLADLATDQRDRRVVIIGHSANQWALDHLVHGTPLEELVGPFEWQPGWRYLLLTGE